MDKALFEFPVQVYGELEKYNEVLSKARCKIFYKYANRNRTYITDEFADKLLNSLPYAPVKGIYDENDYTDHGVARSEGRIYGIVPENPNVSWETFVDDDGVTRTYACADVLIFTALYEEAKEILGKGQSMELYQPSLKYHEAIVENKRYIVFDEGCFLGLQVLGDNVEPCFEGASFYTLQSTIEYAINKIKEYGGTEMPKINFKLSDDEKFSALWALLNPEFNEEGNWTVTYGISAVYDDYALCVNYETGEMNRAYYSKNDEKDMIELGEIVKCYVIDVTENEKATLDTLRVLNGDTYELVSEVLEQAERPTKRGALVMDTAGYDISSVTSMVAGGCQAVIFTTGRGTPTGNAIVPVLKVTANEVTYKKMEDNMDVDLSAIVRGEKTYQEMGKELLSVMHDICNGRMTKAEAYGFSDIAVDHVCRFV